MLGFGARSTATAEDVEALLPPLDGTVVALSTVDTRADLARRVADRHGWQVVTHPAAALAEAWAQTSPKDYDVIKVLLSLPVVVVDDLTAADAVDSGALFGGDGGPALIAAAHVVRRAQARPGWAIVTDRPEVLRTLDPHAEIDELP